MSDKEKVTVVKVTLKIDRTRLDEMITVDQFIGMQEGNTRQIVDVLSLFVWNEKKQDYYSFDEARAMIGKMKISQLVALSESFVQDMKDEAVPPANGPVS